MLNIEKSATPKSELKATEHVRNRGATAKSATSLGVLKIFYFRAKETSWMRDKMSFKKLKEILSPSFQALKTTK